MKKILLFLIVLLLAFNLPSKTTYKIQIDENRTEEVIIPDGMSETDVLLELAYHYYILNDNYNELKTSSEKLTTSVENYISENEILREENNNLIQKYDHLIEDYTITSKTKVIKGLLGADIQFSQESKLEDAFFNIGIILWEKISIYSRLGITVSSQKFVYGIGAFVEF